MSIRAIPPSHRLSCEVERANRYGVIPLEGMCHHVEQVPLIGRVKLVQIIPGLKHDRFG